MPNARKPDKLHLLEGTYRKDRHGNPDKKLKVSAEFPECPGWLPIIAENEWGRIKKIMEASGVITLGDLVVLSQYCMLYSDLVNLKDKFPASKHGQLRGVAAELGLTPIARSKITVTKDDDDEF